jgi:hypothetical protein
VVTRPIRRGDPGEVFQVVDAAPAGQPASPSGVPPGAPLSVPTSGSSLTKISGLGHAAAAPTRTGRHRVPRYGSWQLKIRRLGRSAALGATGLRGLVPTVDRGGDGTRGVYCVQWCRWLKLHGSDPNASLRHFFGAELRQWRILRGHSKDGPGRLVRQRRHGGQGREGRALADRGVTVEQRRSWRDAGPGKGSGAAPERTQVRSAGACRGMAMSLPITGHPGCPNEVRNLSAEPQRPSAGQLIAAAEPSSDGEPCERGTQELEPVSRPSQRSDRRASARRSERRGVGDTRLEWRAVGSLLMVTLTCMTLTAPDRTGV